MMVRKGTGHTYAVVETGKSGKEMNMLNHNGLDVGSPEEVDAAYESLHKVKEEYGITKLQKPRRSHGDYPWPYSVAGMKEALTTCSADEQSKILGGNATRLLHL
jgi:hypothetical protein